MRRLRNTAASLALLTVLAASPAVLADSAQPRPTPQPVAPIALVLPAPIPQAAPDSKDPAASQTLQANANPTALLFLTIMNSGGGGRYGR
jgi:hypothetical protein